VDAFINDVFKGTVQEIRLSPTTSSNVVTYTTLVNANNDDKKLKPGMTANISIFTKEVNSALLISAKALKYKPDSSLSKQYQIVPVKGLGEPGSTGSGPDTSRITTVDSSAVQGYVWVKQDNQLIQKKIITGLNDNTHVEVLSGLSATDEVVTGSEVVAGSAPGASGESSPFMPRRPGGNKKK